MSNSMIDLDIDAIDEEIITDVDRLYEPTEALLRCLNEFGRVDIPRICELTGMTAQDVISALDGAIVRDPAGWNGDFTSGFELLDGYLSGNLNAKLREAIGANAQYNGIFADNIKAIKEVLPMADESKDIYVSLGATWLPAHIIDDFVIKLFGNCRAHESKTFYDPVSAMWSIPYARLYDRNIKNTEVYGVAKLPGIRILEKTLNAQTIEIYKPAMSWEKTSLVIDAEQTELALSKQRDIINIFEQWIMSDKTRAAELRTAYDNKFGGISARHYNGAFLTFPNMNSEIKLRKNQRDAVARIIFNDNTLIAHDVGAGKTFTLIAGGHELHRMGLSEKNLYVVPNAIISQWKSDWHHLYPSDSILVVDHRNFGKDKRQSTLELMRDANYDAILISSSSFALIPMTRKYQIEALQREKAELNHAINTLEGLIKKNIVRMSDKLDERIKKLYEEIAEDERLGIDEGICFDDLGITSIFVDEAHEYKNISIKSRAKELRGINKKGSKKCDDMLAKVRFTQQNGRGAVFATATPISNSLTDIYVMQKFLQSGALKFYGVNDFDAWANTYSEREECIEVDVDSSTLRTTTRLTKFHNLSDLSCLFSQVADFFSDPFHEETYDVIDVKVTCSQELRLFINSLAERAARVRAGGVSRRDDNLLKITSEGRIAALDMRLIEGWSCATNMTKAWRCAENVFDIWKDTEKEQYTQIIFCDLGTPKQGFNVYDELRQLLTLKGIPLGEIAFIHEATTENAKKRMFDAMNKGEIRILIGSTSKLGTGTNVQRLLCAVHHLDVPWKPSDLVQREGRMLRQGNECTITKKIYRYVTKNSFDAVSWQIVERKQAFIAQFMTNTLAAEASCDFEEMALSFAEIKAIAVGNPMVRRRMELQNDLNRMLSLQRGYLEQRRNSLKECEQIPNEIAEQEQLISDLLTDADKVDSEGLVDKEERRAFGEELMEALSGNEMVSEDRFFSEYMGLAIYLPKNMLAEKPLIILRGVSRTLVPMGESVKGNVKRIENAALGLRPRAESLKESLHVKELRLAELNEELKRPNKFAAHIEKLREELSAVDELLIKSKAAV